jgi:hypothetical protein
VDGKARKNGRTRAVKPVSFRVSLDERLAGEAEADLLGISIGELARRLYLGRDGDVSTQPVSTQEPGGIKIVYDE